MREKTEKDFKPAKNSLRLACHYMGLPYVEGVTTYHAIYEKLDEDGRTLLASICDPSTLEKLLKESPPSSET